MGTRTWVLLYMVLPISPPVMTGKMTVEWPASPSKSAPRALE